MDIKHTLKDGQIGCRCYLGMQATMVDTSNFLRSRAAVSCIQACHLGSMHSIRCCAPEALARRRRVLPLESSSSRRT